MKLLLSLLLSLATLTANSQPVEFTVMHAPGGVSDITTRFISKNISDKNYIVVNRPGAAGKIAMAHLMSEKTMLLATVVQVYVTNPLNFNDLNYDTKTDIEVIATIGVMPSALICNNKTGITSYQEFMNTTKSLSFGVGGYGSSEHVATEVLLSKSKNKHIVVPYAQGGNKSVMDLLGGHIDCMFANLPTIKQYLDHENLKFLLTSHNIGAKVPTWETIYKESFPFQSYLSIIVPASMPVSTKQQIANDLKTAFQRTEYKTGIVELGLFLKSDTDPVKIKESLSYNEYIKKFIVDNKIKVSSQ
jgi:tripartite-type tricarboxylate transporter receptor subunit TctC